MLYAPWHNAELTNAEFHTVLAELNLHPSTPHQKHLILMLMVMPGKQATELHELNLLPVEFCDDIGPPMLLDKSTLFSE